jgi:NADPH:quinone reductase-like Zn-dependent oxidoreductase
VPGTSGLSESSHEEQQQSHRARRTKVVVRVEATVVRNYATTIAMGGEGSSNNKYYGDKSSNSSSGSGRDVSATAGNSSRWDVQNFDLDTKLNESAFVGTVDEIETKHRRFFPQTIKKKDNNMNEKNDSITTSIASSTESDTTTLTTPTGKIKKGTLVTSIRRRCATKARLVTLPVEDLIALPAYEDLDLGEVAAVVSTYLPAFGALFYGLDKRTKEGRFSKKALSGSTILINGGGAVEAEAVTKVALLGGAARVFLFQTESAQLLEKLGGDRSKVFALLGEPIDHASRLHRSMDIIVDLGLLTNLEFLTASLSLKGRLVSVAASKESVTYGGGFLSRMKEFVGQATLSNVEGTYIYDFHDVVSKRSKYYGEVIRDLKYLLDLTQRRKLRPRVDRYIKPRDVEIMQEDMVRRPANGTVICEPWREQPHQHLQHHQATPADPDPITSLEQMDAWNMTLSTENIHS